MNLNEKGCKDKINAVSKEERKEEAGFKRESGGSRKLLVEGIALSLAVGLAAACGSTMRTNDDADERSTRRLDAIERDVDADMDEETDMPGDVPEVEDVPDMDAVEDVDEDGVDVVGDLTDAEEDVTGDEDLDASEDTMADAEEDAVEEGDVLTDGEEDGTLDVDEDSATDAEEDVTGDGDLDAVWDAVIDGVTDTLDEDGTVDTVDEDTSLDPIADLDAEEEIVLVCSPFSELSTDVWIDNGTRASVGGVEVLYRGTDSVTGEGIYDIICGGVTVRESVLVPAGGSVMTDVLELGFRVRIDAHTVSDLGTSSDIEVIAGLPVLCTPFDETSTITPGSGLSLSVGGVDVKYKGPDLSGDGVYDILCGGTVLRTDIVIAEGASQTISVPEYGFDITLDVHDVYRWISRLTVEVDSCH